MATKSSKIHVYIFMILIFFLCLLSFSVGTFVGKSVTESEMRKSQGEMAANLTKEREVATAKAEAFEENVEVDESDEEVTLSSDEIDSLAKEFSQEDDAANTETSAADKSAKMQEASKNSKSPISEVTNRIANDKSATKALAKPRKPSTIIPIIAASSLGKYTIQIASYTDEKEATNHASKLKEKGYSAFYVPAQVRGRNWYRVSVGLFENSGAANKFRRSFIKRTQLETAIVQKITK